jgi:hypothetical protein
MNETTTRPERDQPGGRMGRIRRICLTKPSCTGENPGIRRASQWALAEWTGRSWGLVFGKPRQIPSFATRAIALPAFGVVRSASTPLESIER